MGAESPSPRAAWLVENDPTAFDPRVFLAERPVDRATIDRDVLTREQGW